MKTEFTAIQLGKSDVAVSAGAIRKCVHCGFCLATCPTYVLLGDERDSPRGRIYLIKEMLEKEQQPTLDVVRHIDRCLSCLACTTTCPSGVDYMHLIDHARAYVEDRYKRPLLQRWLRWALANVLPFPARLRMAMQAGRLASPLAGMLDRVKGFESITTLLRLARSNPPARSPSRHSVATRSSRRGRVILQQGCVEPVLRPAYREAAVRLLNRVGFDVEFVAGEGCCGALPEHMGRKAQSLAFVRLNVDAWTRVLEERDDVPVVAIVITASGCGTSIKDYGFMLRDDAHYAARAARVSALAKDISELLTVDMLRPQRDLSAVQVAYHSACSLQHGQKVVTQPRELLAAAGFQVSVPNEAHLCCGSAGTYNILESAISRQLGTRKAGNLAALNPDVVATGNIGCAVQIGSLLAAPVVHVVELIDWATGGPVPFALAHRYP